MCKVDDKEYLESLDGHCGESNSVTSGRVNSVGAPTNPDDNKSGGKYYSVVSCRAVVDGL